MKAKKRCPFMNSPCMFECCGLYDDDDERCSLVNISISLNRISDAEK